MPRPRSPYASEAHNDWFGFLREPGNYIDWRPSNLPDGDSADFQHKKDPRRRLWVASASAEMLQHLHAIDESKDVTRKVWLCG